VGSRVTVFIDQLRVRQDHADCPEWGSIRRYDFNIETGELVYDAVHGMQVEGSCSTSVRPRSDGRSVEFLGNPSKFGRLDNLIGIPTMGGCVAIVEAGHLHGALEAKWCEENGFATPANGTEETASTLHA